MSEEVSQKDLLGQLEKSDVKVDKQKAEEMKENILNDKGGANYLGLGVHDVVVTSVELKQARTGTMGMKFNVENADGRSDVTMWLSEGALPYTIENVSRLMVHNSAEDKKAEAKNFMSNIVSAKDLYDTVQETLKGRAKTKTPFNAYLSIKEDKNGNTYTDKNGIERPSLTRNLLPYKPKETPTQAVASVLSGEGVVVDADTTIGNLPF